MKKFILLTILAMSMNSTIASNSLPNKLAKHHVDFMQQTEVSSVNYWMNDNFNDLTFMSPYRPFQHYDFINDDIFTPPAFIKAEPPQEILYMLAIPEPEPYYMFIAGLGIIVLITKRRLHN